MMICRSQPHLPYPIGPLKGTKVASRSAKSFLTTIAHKLKVTARSVCNARRSRLLYRRWEVLIFAENGYKKYTDNQMAWYKKSVMGKTKANIPNLTRISLEVDARSQLTTGTSMIKLFKIPLVVIFLFLCSYGDDQNENKNTFLNAFYEYIGVSYVKINLQKHLFLLLTMGLIFKISKLLTIH